MARRSLARSARIAASIAWLGCGLSGVAAADDHPGRASYVQYCSACHGIAADGNGPVAPVMKVAPPDLRTLGRIHGMPLPVPKVRDLVDGRNMVRAHGTSDMPVWGEDLARGVPSTTGTELFRRGTIVAILDYIESIQIP